MHAQMSEFFKKTTFAYFKCIRFLRTKKIWKKPKKSEVLVYDKVDSEVLMEYIDTGKIELLDTRNESINIYILCKTFFSKRNYFEEYIDYVNPIHVITFVDNSTSFLLLKKTFPEKIFIFIQNGYRGGPTDIFYILDQDKEKNESYHVDHMLTFSRSVGEKYSQYIEGEVTPIGSLRNNAYKPDVCRNTNSVLFISEYRLTHLLNGMPHWHDSQKTIDVEEFRSAENSIIPFLERYCRRKGLYLNICGSTYEQTGEEFRYYRSLLNGNDWEFIPRTNYYSSYEHCRASDFIVFIHSTLGYESIASGNKTVSFSIRARMLDMPHLDFGWPETLPDNGPFWTNLNDEREFERLMDYITAVTDNEWDRIRKRYLPGMIEYDPGNSKFIRKMKTIGVPLNSGQINGKIFVKKNTA